MKTILVGLALLVSVSSVWAQSNEVATSALDARAFNSALVLSGGGANWPVFTGVYEGLKKQGANPDLIVGVCGGSVAAAMISAQPDLDFSSAQNVPEGFLFTKDVKIKDPLLPAFLPRFIDYKGWIKDDLIGNVIAPTMLDIPSLNKIALFNQPFNEHAKRRLIIFGTRLLYDPYKLEKTIAHERIAASQQDGEQSNPGRPSRNGRKLFRLTIFTDVATAKILRAMNLKSKPGVLFPNSAMDDQIDIVDNATIGDAVRASISDPVLTTPALVNGHYYLTGATDNYPIEIVDRLAKTITHTYWAGLPKWQDDLFKSVFKFSSNASIAQTDRKPVAHWVLLGEMSPELRKLSMNPAVKIPMIKSGFPQTMPEYQRVYEAFFEFGYTRALKVNSYPAYRLDPMSLPASQLNNPMSVNSPK